MHLTFRYRLLPSRRQHRALEAILESQRQLYNAALEERIGAFRKAGITRTYFDQTIALTQLRAEEAEFRAVPANLQRATLKRLDDAYRGFFGRCARGVTPGFPRFRGKGWFDSFGFREFCGVSLSNGRIRFKGLPGGLRVHLHRPLPEAPDIRSCLFRRSPKGWEISFRLRVAEGALRCGKRHVGVDLGIKRFAALSDGGFIPSLGSARRAQSQMRRLQRALARKKSHSATRAKVRKSLGRLHQRITARRDAFLHRAAARLIREYDVIVIEQLNVRPMLGTTRARSIHDAAWMKFIRMLEYKAEKAGVRIVAVDPRQTTQQCSSCGGLSFMTLRHRQYACGYCGITMDRDLNSAKNVLNRAAAGPGLHNAAAESMRAGANLAHDPGRVVVGESLPKAVYAG